ncbi:uncharacterized protein [Clytia hemisphaerica]|uniref:uncharacterized protein n=1 Tax=Clytia hemisphaerica TaxID=252671 RepID=UPI0034D585D0
MTSSTGYGPSANNLWQNIAFDGDERKFELWEVKFLGYMNIRKLKHVFVSEDEITAEKNELAFSELIQFLDERSISLIMRDARDNGRLAFKILKEHYAGSGKPRIITLYTQLTSLIKRNNESITDYILRAESAANALCTAKETVSDGLLVAMVVKGLPDQYKSFIAVTTQSEDVVQDFQKFKQALKNFEDTEQTRNKRPDSTEGDNIMKTDSYRTKKLTCFNCGAAGHKSTDCRKPKKQNYDKPYCSYHKTNSHSNETCRKQKQQHTAKTVSDESEGHSFVFTVEDIQAATKKGTKLNFEGDHAELITTDGTTFPIEQHGRLYYLCKTSVSDTRTESLKTWHKLLGHCNLSDVKKLEGAQGMNISDKSDFDCETCILAKQTNTRNRDADIRATKPFELVHTDLAGPVDPVAKDGHRYAMIFVDDFSGCSFTYFLKNKSDALQATEKFLADTNPFGNVKTFNFHTEFLPTEDTDRLRSDNGGEYISAEFKALLLKYNIKHELTSPYSPHQNGTAERNWRTLFEMARSLLIEANLPKSLWTYAVLTATHIRNRCYVQRLKTTPYSVITGRKPDISKMHLFGSVLLPSHP